MTGAWYTYVEYLRLMGLCVYWFDVVFPRSAFCLSLKSLRNSVKFSPFTQYYGPLVSDYRCCI